MNIPPRPAVRATLEVLRCFGIEPDRCEVLQDGHTLVLRLTATLVARVVQGTEGPRQGMAWFARETAVAAHLTRHQAPVIPLHPDLPPCAHEHAGYPMNFWRYVTATGETPEPWESGHTLRRCHDALATLAVPLPHWAILHESLGLLRERQLLAEADQALLVCRLEQSLAGLEGAPAQPLHGDAHPGNLLATTEGLLWTDWEDAFLGPIEWDLASLIWNAKLLDRDEATAEAMIRGYEEAGGAVDRNRLDVCLVARAAVMCAWYPILYPNPDAERRARLRQRLAWLETAGG